MSSRRSLKLPIALGVVMIVLLVALTVGWILLAVFGALGDSRFAPLYWTLLTVGTAFLIFVLLGVVMYLVLSIKAINLNRRQSNFMDSITHELKSPIASLKLYLQTLNRRQVSSQEQEDFCRYMLEDVERLDELINHLLEAARLERKPVGGEIEEIDLSELLAECAEAVCVRYRVPLETIRLELQPCAVRARRVDVDMIFRNLIDNAVKYAGTEPRVVVSLTPTPSGSTTTRIADNGRGIPRPLRRKIFGRFVRLGMELQREKPGTGLGLYIVRTLVVRMRGRIRVRDAIDGTGTVFEVQLPGVPLSENVPHEHPPLETSQSEVA